MCIVSVFRDLPLPAVLAGCAIIGLCIGSFLNVVICRLPKQLLWQWRQECEVFLAESIDTADAQPPATLCFPRSACPKCGHVITWWENIPLLSFLLLKGRCRSCYARIAWRYPLIELLSALCPLFALYHFGIDLKALYATGFLWVTLVLAYIDLDHLFLPDGIVFLLLWAGILINLFGAGFCTLPEAVWGVVIGYGALWLVMHGYKWLTKKEAMGHGDFKLVAAFGAWFGVGQLLLIVMTGAFAGLLIAGPMLLFSGKGRDTQIPFGPFLILGAWLSLFWGNLLVTHYLQLFWIA